MAPRERYKLLEVTDERIKRLNQAVRELVEDQAESFFLSKDSPLSSMWDEMITPKYVYPVRCALSAVIQDMYDYQDIETGKIDQATFDFKFQILTMRKDGLAASCGPSTPFVVWCVVPAKLIDLEDHARIELIKRNLEMAREAVDSFADCACIPTKRCFKHNPPWQDKVYESYRI